MSRPKWLALAAAGAGLALAGPAAADEPVHGPWAGRVVDLTQTMSEDMPVWPGGVPFRMTRTADYDRGYRAHRFEVGENTGTHVDAPAHFVPGGRTIDELEPAELVVPAVVIDAREQAAADPDYRLTADDLGRWEGRHGRIPAGALVILETGWHARFAEPARYVNSDSSGVMHFPGFAADAAGLLLRRDVAGIGIDTLSLDPGDSTDFPVHRLMLGAGKYQIENLANLDALPPTGATVVVGVLPVGRGTQAQARVLALLP